MGSWNHTFPLWFFSWKSTIFLVQSLPFFDIFVGYRPCLFVKNHQIWKIWKNDFLRNRPFLDISWAIGYAFWSKTIKVEKFRNSFFVKIRPFLSCSWCLVKEVIDFKIIEFNIIRTRDHTSESSMCWSAVWQREALHSGKRFRPSPCVPGVNVDTAQSHQGRKPTAPGP